MNSSAGNSGVTTPSWIMVDVVCLRVFSVTALHVRHTSSSVESACSLRLLPCIDNMGQIKVAAYERRILLSIAKENRNNASYSATISYLILCSMLVI